MAVEGLAKLNARLKAIPKAAKDAAIKVGVQSGNELAAMQKRLAPVEEGDLRDSIAVTPPGGTTPPYSQPGGSRTARPMETIVTAGNNKVRTAHLVEFGTAPHINGGWAAGTQHPGTAPQPFFWPAYRALRKRIKSRNSRAINKAIKDEFNK
jgi:HK97 gp10 family phage protein